MWWYALSPKFSFFFPDFIFVSIFIIFFTCEEAYHPNITVHSDCNIVSFHVYNFAVNFLLHLSVSTSLFKHNMISLYRCSVRSIHTDKPKMQIYSDWGVYIIVQGKNFGQRNEPTRLEFDQWGPVKLVIKASAILFRDVQWGEDVVDHSCLF